MLDKQDRHVVLGADGAQQLVEFFRLARVETGRRLVEAEEPRLGAHGTRDLEAALVAIGQVARRVIGAVDQAHLLEPRLGEFNGILLGAAVMAAAEHAGHGVA